MVPNTEWVLDDSLDAPLQTPREIDLKGTYIDPPSGENGLGKARKRSVGTDFSMRLDLIRTAGPVAITCKNPRVMQTGPRFRQRVEAIVEAFSSMRQELGKERKAIMKHSGQSARNRSSASWARRSACMVTFKA
jgi:hypothetical protein